MPQDDRVLIERWPALDSRILVWQRYKSFTPAKSLTVIPQYHPLWTAVPTDDPLWIDDLACHGNFRQWAKLTYLIIGRGAALPSPHDLRPHRTRLNAQNGTSSA
ncbi:hypothetical protein ACFQ6E_39550 [Streptomyces sp. NPDC056462]|uniref:hypothetical protein n=1 Tax=Streptomyces sp. NPDC056462 TaxID=3345826 RepID=UPI0036B0CD93